MRVVDLFAGVGGLSFGFAMANFETVFAIDSSCSIANTVSKLAIVKPKESPPTPENKSTTLIL